MKKFLSAICISAMFAFASVALAVDVPSYGGTYSGSNANAIQEQGQTQGQGQAQELSNSGNSAVVFENSFNGAKPIRYLPMASDVTYTGMAPQMFSRPQQDKGENFIAATNLITLMAAWNVADLSDDDFDLDDVIIDITTIGITTKDAIGIENLNSVKFCIQGTDDAKALKTNGSKILALGTIKSDDEETNSFELFYAIAKKAKELGGSNVVLIGEGVKLELESSGWGIGLSYNYAGVNSDSSGYGQVGAGGTGISGGHASYHKMPYLAFAIMD